MLDIDFKSQFNSTKTSFFSNKLSDGNGPPQKQVNVEDQVEKLLAKINKNDNKGDGDEPDEATDDVVILAKSKNLKGVSDQAILSSVVAGVLATTLQLLVETVDKYNIDISKIINEKWLNNYVASCERLFEF
jgi:hypothetical protein